MKFLTGFKVFVAVILAVVLFSTQQAESKASSSYSAIVISKTVNVREKPSLNSKILGTLKKGEKITVYSKQESIWCEIRYNKKKAFTASKSLKIAASPSVTIDGAFAASAKKGQLEGVPGYVGMSYSSLQKTVKGQLSQVESGFIYTTKKAEYHFMGIKKPSANMQLDLIAGLVPKVTNSAFDRVFGKKVKVDSGASYKAGNYYLFYDSEVDLVSYSLNHPRTMKPAAIGTKGAMEIVMYFQYGPEEF